MRGRGGVESGEGGMEVIGLGEFVSSSMCVHSGFWIVYIHDTCTDLSLQSGTRSESIEME